MWSEGSQEFSLWILAQLSLLSDLKEYKTPELCVTGRKVTRAGEERSYCQLEDVHVSLVDVMLYLDCSHAHRQHGKQALMEEVTWHLEGPGLCALRRTGGTGGATEAPVSLWRGRQEMGADWTHMASVV